MLTVHWWSCASFISSIRRRDCSVCLCGRLYLLQSWQRKVLTLSWQGKLCVCDRVQGNSPAELARTKDEYDAFLADPGNLARVAEAEGGSASEEQAKVLRVLRRTFATYIAEDERVTAIKASSRSRNSLELLLSIQDLLALAAI